ncbi:MAG: protein kinase domain-containing protein [Gemmatimonadaceae bacterium]
MRAELDRIRSALADRYAVTDVLGEGGMATVYRATDLRHNRAVAIKVLRPELSQAIGSDRFLREIEIAAGLQHPRIVPVYDSGEADGLLYFVMPVVEGETLRDRLSREKQLPVVDALRIAREVANALAYAHARGIVHRDIKPENILLFGGESIVADFGIARAFDAAGGTRLTMTGMSIGTPAYMSPEQAAGDPSADARSDIYSLGCLLYEMLVGQPPFTGPTAESVVRQHMAAAVPQVALIRPSATISMERAIARALAKSPADRFQTATEFVDALVAPEVPPSPRPSALYARRGVIVGATLAVAAVAVAIVALLQRRAPTTIDPSVIAVMPFRVSGDSSFAFLREGMVDLLTTQLGSMSEMRPLESRTMLATWRRAVGAGDDPSISEVRSLAASLGSGRFVLGEVVGTGHDLLIGARMVYVNDERQTEASVKGPRDSLFALVDRLTSQLLARSAGEPGRRIADLTSTSLSAVRAYLDGRAAYRRGEITKAIERFSDALAADSTFALAALGMASAGVWSQQSGQSAALRRGLRSGYALRDRLPRRDQLLFEAYVLPSTTSAHSSSEQLAAWRRAAESAPDSPEAQFEYGDRLYHNGAQLGISDAQARAKTAFERALSLDSTFAAPLAHLVEIAARSGDRDLTRRLAALYRGDGASADAGDYVRWRVAVALSDDRTLAALRARLDRIGSTALNRIIGFGQADVVALADVDTAARELSRRLDAHAPFTGNAHPSQTLRSWALNRGRRSVVAHALAALRASEPIPPGSSIVYFTADQVPVLDAMFWDGDSTTAAEAALRIERQIAGTRPRESGARARYYTDLCVAALWRLTSGRSPGVEGLIDRLRAGTSTRDSAAVHGADPLLCLTMLDAMTATSRSAAEAEILVARLDSTLVAAPYVFGIDFGNLVLARLYEARGDHAAALRALRRRPYDWDTGPLYLTTFLREEGRVAALTGDRVGAARAYEQFLALRAGADSVYQPQTHSVRGALADLRNGR